jgi:hypothetical protein
MHWGLIKTLVNWPSPGSTGSTAVTSQHWHTILYYHSSRFYINYCVCTNHL